MLPPLQCMGIQFETSSHRVWVRMDKGSGGVCYTVSMGALTSSRSYAAVGATAAATATSGTCPDDKKETWALKQNYFKGITSVVADPGQALKLEIWTKKDVRTDSNGQATTLPTIIDNGNRYVMLTTHCGCTDTVKMVAESGYKSIKNAIDNGKIDCLGTGKNDDPYYDCTFPSLLFGGTKKTFWGLPERGLLGDGRLPGDFESDGESRLTAAIPTESRYCSCKLSVLHGLQLQPLWRIATAAVS